MIQYKKSKFSKFEWNLIKSHLDGYIGEIHHCLGKQYEYLATLSVMTKEDHNNGFNHHKYIHGLPENVREKNLKQWKEILNDDYDFFVVEGFEG